MRAFFDRLKWWIKNPFENLTEWQKSVRHKL